MPVTGKAEDLRPATGYPECIWPVTDAIHILCLVTYTLAYIPLSDLNPDQLGRRIRTEPSVLFTVM